MLRVHSAAALPPVFASVRAAPLPVSTSSARPPLRDRPAGPSGVRHAMYGTTPFAQPLADASYHVVIIAATIRIYKFSVDISHYGFRLSNNRTHFARPGRHLVLRNSKVS